MVVSVKGKGKSVKGKGMSHSCRIGVFVLEFAIMDDQRKTLIVTGAVVLIILALIISLIFFLTRFISSRRQSASPTPTVAPSGQTPGETASPAPGNTSAPVPNAKSYKGVGFELAYPNNWGLLTCNNSVNFEFDPEKSQDMLKVNCDRAVKPITVLVSDNLSCQGDNIKLGNNSVVRIVEGTKGAEADYRWCVINPNGVDLDITQRVSNSGRPSSSRQDFAVQIEQVISSVNFSR
ncbi:MAG: hypothetical protein ACD_30C00014G0006 [uncultured bacterium]|uniref:Uncharacterized protein n=3 Tax=Candidatus Daviesiibacteriota TaxID=1752718 RepID=A0A0G0EWY7_9BACT|nr:MAG: hypothetical protein ACD_30C00014G0006 [uncultured bacterium]KKQ10007.1 MAG: hypothetical protein US19_C0009G0009 [Candidatus Daviesbacteria bacterium GW2011_GWB1_36_5]KKQ14708.1 MAG: hypothetical protein US28_C0032G0010 [Candidatus Daviesbacteria bacterium GW2011_GWA1_36_8]OGE33100.1 MAG: hypothetical protein A3C99_03685 [Candidatus Daviesbacteria bacterium RIFCSPHIGHO2_02_FULL_37_9]OGE36698.1 MAG: hypothetical protein A3E66_02085 [Candidatus Daviesbacteria bacterium RIFCSPHIGHO2_12_FU